MLTHLTDSTIFISGGIVFVAFVMITGFVRAFRKAGPTKPSWSTAWAASA